jgi:putative DNA primase/helicase
MIDNNLDNNDKMELAQQFEQLPLLAGGILNQEEVPTAVGDLSDDRVVVTIVLETFLHNIKNTTLREAAGIQDDVAVTEKIMVVIVIDYLVETAKTFGWALARFEDSFFLYTGTHWQMIDADDLKSFLGRAAVKIGVSYYVAKHFKFREDLLKQFYSAGYFAPPISDSGETKINLNNGTFVITTNGSDLKPWDKDDFLRYKLPFGFDPDATCPKFDNYLNRVLPDVEKQKVIAEYLGYVFIRNSILKLEKSLILYGSGANGKSVLFELVQQLLGPSNVSNYTLQSLTDPNGYTRSLLAGKIVNYASEISSKMNPTLFKQLVSGEPVEARMIYGKPFILRDYARLIFNTNVLPSDIENNPGFFRRFIIIDFDQTISNEEKNPMLANEIIKDELPGVFNWILAGLERLLEQGDFSECAAANDAVEKFRRESDSVALFLEDGSFMPFKDSQISLKEFFSHYKDFCKDSNYSACSNKTFSTRLKGYGYEITRQSSGRVLGVKKQ